MKKVRLFAKLHGFVSMQLRKRNKLLVELTAADCAAVELSSIGQIK